MTFGEFVVLCAVQYMPKDDRKLTLNNDLVSFLSGNQS